MLLMQGANKKNSLFISDTVLAEVNDIKSCTKVILCIIINNAQRSCKNRRIFSNGFPPQ